MVATARLFDASIHDAKAIGDIAGYYFDQEAEGYYSAGAQSQGYWFGGGIEHLGLEGFVKQEDLFHLLRGRDPRTKKLLVRLQKQTEGSAKRTLGQDRCGLDITCDQRI